MEKENLEIINSDDRDYYDGKLYQVGIWPGAGYELVTFNVYADCEQTALELVVADAEFNAQGLLTSIPEMEEYIMEDWHDECEEFIEENEDRDADEYTFAEEYLNYIYVDATEYGASQPYFVTGENLRIEEIKDIKEESKEDEIPYDNTSKKVCPKCGREYTDYPALSRRDNKTYICPDCGFNEAMEDFAKSLKKENKVVKEAKDYDYIIYRQRLTKSPIYVKDYSTETENKDEAITFPTEHEAEEYRDELELSYKEQYKIGVKTESKDNDTIHISKDDDMKEIHTQPGQITGNNVNKMKKQVKTESVNDLSDISWENIENYDEEEKDEIRNILDNLDVEAVKEMDHSVAIRIKSNGMVFWVDYGLDGQDIVGDWNQYIFDNTNSDDRIREAIQTSYYESTGETIAFDIMESAGLEYLEQNNIVKRTDDGYRFIDDEKVESYNKDGFQNSEDLVNYFKELNDVPDTITLDGKTYKMTNYGGTGTDSYAIYTDENNDDSYIKVFYSLKKLGDGVYKGIDEIKGVSDLREAKVVESKLPTEKTFGRWKVVVVDKNGKPVAKFYDMDEDPKKFPDGQFVSSYYVETLLGQDGYGRPINEIEFLSLDNGVPEWVVQKEDLENIYNWLVSIDNDESLTESKSLTETDYTFLSPKSISEYSNGPVEAQSVVSCKDAEDCKTRAKKFNVDVESVEPGESGFIATMKGTLQDICNFISGKKVNMYDFMAEDTVPVMLMKESKDDTQNNVALEIAKVHFVDEDINDFKKLNRDEQFNKVFKYLTEVEYDLCVDADKEDKDQLINSTIKELEQLKAGYTDKTDEINNAISKFNELKTNSVEEAVDYISKKDFDKIPNDYKTTVKDTINTAPFRGEDEAKVRKMYKDLGYDEEDPMIMSNENGKTVLKPVKVQEGKMSEIDMDVKNTLKQFEAFLENEGYDDVDDDVVNEFFTDIFYNIETEEEMEAMNIAEKEIRHKYGLKESKSLNEENVIATYDDGTSTVKVVKANNGKFVNYYYDGEDKEHWSSNAGPFDSSEEAEKMTQKHRPLAKKVEDKSNIDAVYVPEKDVSVIFDEVTDDNGNAKSTEVTGFYYGSPDDELTKQYNGKLKATYNLGESKHEMPKLRHLCAGCDKDIGFSDKTFCDDCEKNLSDEEKKAAIRKVMGSMKITEAEELSPKQIFIDYCKDKIKEIKPITVETEFGTVTADVLMVETIKGIENAYIVSPEELDYDDDTLVVVNPETNEIELDTKMTTPDGEASEMTFTYITPEFYDYILEYWDDLFMDDAISLDMLIAKQTEKVEKELKLPNGFKYNTNARGGGLDVEIYDVDNYNNKATTTTMKGTEYVQEYFDIDGLWQVSIIDENGKFVNYEYVTGWQKAVELLQKQKKTPTTESKELKHPELNNNIKDFYTSSYESDDVGNQLKDTVTFQQLYRALKDKVDIYEVIGTNDSTVRERLFNELARILNTDYDYVYNMWQYGAVDGQPNVIKEDVSNNNKKTVELNTGVLPIVDVDMYSLSDELNSYDVEFKDLDEIVMEIAPKYIEDTISEILPNVSVIAKSVYHPNQYNYSGDELEFDLVLDNSSYETLKDKTIAKPEFAQYLKEKYSSRSGFVSYMADDIDDFNMQDDWKQVVQVIMFNISEDRIQSNNEQYVTEFLDNVSMNYAPVEDELEENKKITETGEWDDSDLEMQSWLEAMKKDAEELAKAVNGKVKTVKGFDKYQGPFAIVQTPKYGDVQVWNDAEDMITLNVYIAHKGWVSGSVQYIADLLNKDEIPQSEIITESKNTKFEDKDKWMEDYEELDGMILGYAEDHNIKLTDAQQNEVLNDLAVSGILDTFSDFKSNQNNVDETIAKAIKKVTNNLNESLSKDCQDLIRNAIKDEKEFGAGNCDDDLLKTIFEDLDSDNIAYDKDEVENYFYSICNSSIDELDERLLGPSDDVIADSKAKGLYTEAQEDKDLDVVSYNITDGGYKNNADTVYGTLTDGTYFVYYPEMDLVETYDCEPDELIDILYASEDEMPDEARTEAYNDFFEQHNVNTYTEGPLFDKLHKLYFEDDDTLDESKEIEKDGLEDLSHIIAGSSETTINNFLGEEQPKWLFLDTNSDEISKKIKAKLDTMTDDEIKNCVKNNFKEYLYLLENALKPNEDTNTEEEEQSIYETVFIIKGSLDETEAKKISDDVVENVFNGINMIKDEEYPIWVGKRELSFEIQKEKFGYYSLVSYKTDSKTARKVTDEIKATNGVIKVVTIRLPEDN